MVRKEARVDKVSKILSFIGNRDEGEVLAISYIAKETGVHFSTTEKILLKYELEDAGYSLIKDKQNKIKKILIGEKLLKGKVDAGKLRKALIDFDRAYNQLKITLKNQPC